MIKNMTGALALLVVIVGISWCFTILTADWDQVEVTDVQGRKLDLDVSEWRKRSLAGRVELDKSMINLTTDQKVDYKVTFSSSENTVKSRTFNAYVDSDSVWLIEDVPLKTKGRYTLRVRDGMFGESVLKEIRGLRFD